MPESQRYQSLSILLCFILFFGIAKCDNVFCFVPNCQSSQSFDATGTGQTGSFLFTLGAGYEITLDIYPSSNEQDWSIDIASTDTVSQMTVSALLGSQAQIGPVTGAHLTGTFYLTQALETSRYVRFRIKNTNSILSDQIDLTLTVTRFVPLHYSGATRSFKLNGVIIVAVAGAILVLIIIGITVCCIRRRKRLALQKRQQAANRSAIDPIVSTTQLNNTSFQQQNMAYMPDSSFNSQQFGRPAKPQAQVYELQPVTQMYMPAYTQPQPQLQLQVQVQPQPQQIMVQTAPQGH